MKNILILNLGREFGGTEKYIFNIIDNIDLNKYNIHICGIKNSVFINKLIDKNIESIKILEVNINKKNVLSGIKEIKNYININNIEIIHSNGISGDLISNLSRIGNKSVRIISTVHGFSDFDRMDRNYIERKLFSLIEKCLFSFNDMYIAVSESVKEYLINRGLSKTKIDVVYHCIDIRKNNMYNEFLLERDIINLGSVGRLENVKGFDILIRAVKILKDRGYKVNLNLVGDGSQHDYLKNLIVKLGIQENVNLKGFKMNVNKYIEEMAIYIQPSRQESFGISILEAMNNNKPIIAANVGGISEIINDENNGLLFESENSEELAEKIIFLINNKDKAKKFAKQGKIDLIRRFSCEEFSKTMEKIYDKK